jgi:NAD(P)-dependent dehydrogenase (short-subunit alcohol dehydrogenase family)
MLLDGKVALVTGAASRRGIGRATAALFAEHGARLVVLDVDGPGAEAAAAALPGSGHLPLACDVTDAAACDRACAEAVERLGRVDVLVNNAGISQALKLMEIDRQSYDLVMDVCLRGALNMSQAVVPHMRARRAGAIVMIASVAGQRGGGLFGGPHYAAAKAGMQGLGRAMARELGPDNIRVNCVAPSVVDTDIFKGALSEARKAEIAASVPLGRLGAARDVAGACLFLASDLASYVTGATIDVNGGSHIH